MDGFGVVRRRWSAVALLTVLGVAAAPSAGARSAPGLEVTRMQASSSLHCSGDLAAGPHAPVLLLHGTSASPEDNWAWNWVPTLDRLGWAHCALALPERGSQDMQTSAEYVVHAIRAMHAEAGRRISIVGHSQGGTLARWSFKFWPDTRAKVEDYVAFAAANHGTDRFGPLCPLFGCNGASWQLTTGSRFLQALNADRETWPEVDYTQITSETDEVVSPPTSGWLTPGANVTNVHVQSVCPGRVVDHYGAAFDNAVWEIAHDALVHDGPARPARVDPAACAELVMPGVDRSTFAVDLSTALVNVTAADSLATTHPEEPPLRCYARDDC